MFNKTILNKNNYEKHHHKNVNCCAHCSSEFVLWTNESAGKTKSEVDYLNGAVVRFANRLGIETPVNGLFNETLLRLIEGKLQIEQFSRQPGKLLALIQASE